MALMDNARTQQLVEDAWDGSILPTLSEYITIPNKSPAYDPEWQEHGYVDKALDLIESWCRAQDVPGAQISVHRLPGRTPVLLIEVPGDSDETVLLYGHFDKQPEMIGWRDGLAPWTPVREGDRLYGRGSADDGYATFASLTALKVLKEQGQQHARCVILIEGCEESGSPDLPFYLEALADRIGTPSLIVCLDSGAGNYDQLWATTSLRGIVAGNLHVSLLKQGVHSGAASGIVASSFRVLRQLLDRIEDPKTGAILLPEFYVDIPLERLEQAERLAGILGESVYREIPTLDGVLPNSPDVKELILNKTWRPALSITGAGGLPSLENAGNVLRPTTSLHLSIRVPPTCDAVAATAAVKRALESDPPYGAQVVFEPDHSAAGWNAPATEPWLLDSIEGASQAFFGREVAFIGEGGSIPFMAMLGEKFPKAQFLITGLLGPESSAHGPNEFLHVPTAKKLTSSVVQVIADHYARPQ
jgi:acetylornithine deacetylase/succinyl-diaminopimelate desuccinylase-like protein